VEIGFTLSLQAHLSRDPGGQSSALSHFGGRPVNNPIIISGQVTSPWAGSFVETSVDEIGEESRLNQSGI